MHRRQSAAAAVTLVVALVGTGCSRDEEGPATGMAGDTAAPSSPPAPTTLPTPAPAPTLIPAPRSPDEPHTPPTSPTPPFIEGATWGDSDYGVTLKVIPSSAGRQAWGADDSQAAWQEVLQLSPGADTPGMWEQFDCHWTWARLLEPAKSTWNLEPWRPVVPPERMLAEGCNPGGPEV